MPGALRRAWQRLASSRAPDGRPAPPCPRCGAPVPGARPGDAEMLLVRKCPACGRLPAAQRAQRNVCPECGGSRAGRVPSDPFGLGAAAEVAGHHRPATGLHCTVCGLPMSVDQAVVAQERRIRGTKSRAPGVAESEMTDDERRPVKKATFAAGCFWGVEDTFRGIEGVVATAVGYEGGSYDNPSYRDVCSHKTGHAEAVEVDYDPDRVTYERLLDVFWASHDPTQLNRQGPDVGDQYRSAIFVHDGEQEAAARRSLDELERSGRFRRPIVTQITPATTFWRAEDYHQQYFEKRGGGSCHV